MTRNLLNKSSHPLVLSILLLFAVWKLLSIWVAAEILLPSPEKTLVTLYRIVFEPGFLLLIGHTVARSLIGFFIALIIGLILGIIGGTYKPAFTLLMPLVSVTKATPTMSVILLALIWMHTEIAPILVGFLVIFPMIYTNVVEGIRSIDVKLLEMASIYKIKRKRIIYEIYLPSLSSYLVASATSAMGLNLKVVIAAEVLSQPENCIGTSLYMEQINLNTAGVFAWTIIAILISSIFDYSLNLFHKRTNKWKFQKQEGNSL